MYRCKSIVDKGGSQDQKSYYHKRWGKYMVRFVRVPGVRLRVIIRVWVWKSVWGRVQGKIEGRWRI